jgi:hypothetical protein
LKFELKFFVFDFLKKFVHTTRGRWKNKEMISKFEKFLAIPPEGNEKN